MTGTNLGPSQNFLTTFSKAMLKVVTDTYTCCYNTFHLQYLFRYSAEDGQPRQNSNYYVHLLVFTTCLLTVLPIVKCHAVTIVIMDT